MQGRFVLVVLLIAISLVGAQFPAAPFTPLVRSLSIQDTPLLNQQLPPCYSVDYVVATPGTPYQSTGSVIQANVYFLEFTPTTTTNIALPTQPVTIQLFWRSGDSGALNPIDITSEFTTAVNGTNYGACSYVNSLATYTSGSSSSCGLNYYCSGINQLNQVQGLQYVVRISTSASEQQNGIIFNLRLAQRIIPATILQWNVPATISSQTPTAGVNLFIPTQYQQNFYVNFVPKGQDALSIAQYYATASGLVDISFRVYNVLVNGLNTTTSSSWSLAVNQGDLAVTNIQPTTVDFPTQCASVGRNDTQSISSTGYVEIRTLACSLLFDDAFISVGLPQTTATSYTYTIIAEYVGTNTVNFITYVPTFTTISANNTIIPSMVGNNVDFNFVGNAYKQDNYWLNLVSPTIDSNTYVFVTIFGIAPSYVHAQLTDFGLGFESACPTTEIIDQCSNYNQASTGDLVRDYCKMQITSCQFKSSGTYFVSVGGSENLLGNYYSTQQATNLGNGQQLTSTYSILVQLFTIDTIQIPSLSSVVSNGFRVYTDINYVAELKYNHYVINLDSDSINQFSYMIAQVYANREQTGLSLYYNQATLAGSDSTTYDYYGNDFYSPEDGCYDSIRSCTTSISQQTDPSVPSPPLGSSTCSFVLLYCDLMPGGNLYFSVFGHLVPGIDNPNSLTYRLGYNRSVSYTVDFAYRTTPELLFDRITNVQHMPKNLFGLNVQSHQFLLQVPLPSTGELISRIQVAFHAFQHQCAVDQLYTLYMGCMPTGPCPCYDEEQSISLNSAFTHYIRLESDLCACPSGAFYVSVVSNTNTAACNQVTAYQLTPFFQYVDLLGDYTHDSNPLVVSTTGILYASGPIVEPSTYPGYTQTALNVYRIRNTNQQSTSDALSVDINYTHYVENADYATNLIGYLVRGTPSTSFECAVDTCAPYVPQWYYNNRYYVSTYYGDNDQLFYCNLRVDSCHFTADNYYIVLSLNQANLLSNQVSKATIDYTISVTTEDWLPVTLTVNRPIRDSVATRQYKHYQLAVSSVTAGSSLRISVYLNQATERMISLYLNYDSLAGSPTNCYDFISQCNFGSATFYYSYYINYYYYQYYEQNFGSSQYCDFFLDSCEIPSSGTIYVSVYNGHNYLTPDEVFYEYFSLPNTVTANNVVPAAPQEFTIVAETQSVTPISLTLGYPTTGLLLYGQSTYYSFTVDSSNYSPLVIQVQSIEPYPFSIGETIIETLVSFTPQTGSAVTGNCHCNGDVFLNGFSEVTYNCNNIVGGTYYVTVRSSLVAVYTPVSYTLRAYYRPRRLTPLTPQTNVDYTNATFTAVPTLMNYNDIQDFSISFTNTANSVLYVAIADVSYWDTTSRYVRRYLDAYLNFAYPGSPACYDQYESIQNQIIETPNRQIMWVFHVPPCQACSGTWYLSIFARFQQPQPAPQYRLNFTVAAWTVPISVPPSFAISTTFRSDALTNSGYAYTWPTFASSGNVYCDSRFSASGNSYMYNYYFLTTSLQVNQYETLSIGFNSIVGSSDLRFFIKQSTPADNNACTSCETSPSFNCNYGCTAVTAVYYGAFGFDASTDCSSLQSDTVSQETLTFNINDDNLYTINTNVVNVNMNGTTTSTLNGRTITRFLFSFTGIDLSQWSDFSWEYDITGPSSGTGACFNVGSTGASFPPDSCANDCNTPIDNIDFDACCIDTTDTFVLTVYNQDQTSSNTATVTITTDLVPNAYPVLQSLTVGNTAPTSASAQFSSPNSNLYKFYTFNLVAGQNWQTDYVLDLQVFITSGSGSTTVYLNNGQYAAAPDNCFVGSIFTCTTSGSDNSCNVQFPPCLVNQPGTYYLGLISSATSSNLFIYAQPTALFTSTSTGFSPEINSATNSFYTHRKFVYLRTIGDVGLSYQDASYQVSLRTNTIAQVLELSIHNPYAVSSNAGNFLAGNSGINSINSPSCPYQHDSQWQCSGSGRQTDTNGVVTCTVSLCTSNSANTYTDISGQIYVAVRNIQSSPSVTGFTLTAGVVNLGTQPSNVQVITLNTINTSTDQDFTTTCTSATTLTGGCDYPASSTITTVYFNIPITSSNWQILDYLMINFTDISGSSISVSAWPADNCEPPSSADTQCTSGSLTQPCILGSTPTTFTQSFRSDPGNNQVISPFVRNFWVRVSGLTSTTTFQIQARQVTPVTAVRTLSRTSPSVTQSWVMWNYRYLMYNVITPSGGDYSLTYTVSASCYSTGNSPALFVNFDQYRWADQLTYEREYSLSPSISDRVDSCDIVNGGNVFFTIVTDVDSVNFPGTQINEGVVAPQVRVTFSASLIFHPWSYIPWQCSQDLPTTADVYSYVIIGDAENFGTQVAFGFDNCPGCSLLVISPLYRETFDFVSQSSTYGETIQPIPQANYDTEYIWQSTSSCSLPTSTSNGVYSLESTGASDQSQSLTIPACSYRNGRYFVQLTKPSLSGATLWTKISRKTIPVISVLSPSTTAKVTSTIRNTPIFGSSEYFYEYFQVAITRSQTLKFRAEITISKSLEKSLIPYSLAGVLTRGITHVPIATGDCYQAACTTYYPTYSIPNEPCQLYDNLCDVGVVPGDTLYYYIGVTGYNSFGCESIPYELNVYTSLPVYSDITSGVAVCETIHPAGTSISQEGLVKQTSTTVTWTLGRYLNDRFNPQFINVYRLVLTGIKFASLEIRTQPLGVNYNVGDPSNFEYYVGYSSQLPYLVNKNAACGNCYAGPISYTGVVEQDINDLTPALSVTCGLGDVAYISVYSGVPFGNQNNIGDYQLLATLRTRASVALSGTSPSATYTNDTVFSFNNAQTQQVIRRPSTGSQLLKVTTADNPVIDSSANCEDGCQNVDVGCTYLSQPVSYFFVTDYTNSPISSTCHTTIANPQTISLTTFAVNTLPKDNVVLSVDETNPIFFVRTFTTAELSQSSSWRVRITSLNRGTLTVSVGCGGAVSSSDVSTCGYFVETFSTSSTLEGGVYGVYGSNCQTCSSVWVTVTASSDCDMNGYGFDVTSSFSLVVELFPNGQPQTGTSLLSTWQAGAIQRYAQSLPLQVSTWTVTSTASGFVHIGLGNVNGTVIGSVGPVDTYGHVLVLDVYLNGCIVGSCSTGLTVIDNPDRYNNNDYSCFVSIPTSTTTQTYLAAVSVTSSNPISNFFASANFRIQAINSYTDLSDIDSFFNLIQGRARHYYSVRAMNSGVPISVVVHLNILDGPRLLLTVADTPDYMTSYQDLGISYDGWYQQKVCPFSDCAIEISTLASHPRVPVLYIWVTTVPTDTDDWRTPEEKPTDYIISGSIGTQNCIPASQALVGPFCSSVNVTNAPGGVWFSRTSPSILDSEAECTYNGFLCRCVTPSQSCQAALKEFACLEPFVGCNSQGFKIPKCRSNCQYVVDQCGSWTSQPDTDCDCQSPQFNCDSAYYASSAPCSGSDIASTSASVSVIGFVDTTLTAPTSLDCATPSPSPTPNPFFSASPTPSPFGPSSSSSTLSFSKLIFVLCAFILVWFA